MGVSSGSETGPIRRLLASAGNLLATLLSIGRTRLELLTVEVQLEIRRTAELAVWLVIAIQAAMVGLIMAAFWVVIAFWDTHRLLAAGMVTAAFLGIAFVATLVLARKVRVKPPFLGGTLAELARDSERLRERR